VVFQWGGRRALWSVVSAHLAGCFWEQGITCPACSTHARRAGGAAGRDPWLPAVPWAEFSRSPAESVAGKSGAEQHGGVVLCGPAPQLPLFCMSARPPSCTPAAILHWWSWWKSPSSSCGRRDWRGFTFWAWAQNLGPFSYDLGSVCGQTMPACGGCAATPAALPLRSQFPALSGSWTFGHAQGTCGDGEQLCLSCSWTAWRELGSFPGRFRWEDPSFGHGWQGWCRAVWSTSCSGRLVDLCESKCFCFSLQNGTGTFAPVVGWGWLSRNWGGLRRGELFWGTSHLLDGAAALDFARWVGQHHPWRGAAGRLGPWPLHSGLCAREHCTQILLSLQPAPAWSCVPLGWCQVPRWLVEQRPCPGRQDSHPWVRSDPSCRSDCASTRSLASCCLQSRGAGARPLSLLRKAEEVWAKSEKLGLGEAKDASSAWPASFCSCCRRRSANRSQICGVPAALRPLCPCPADGTWPALPGGTTRALALQALGCGREASLRSRCPS